MKRNNYRACTVTNYDEDQSRTLTKRPDLSDSQYGVNTYSAPDKTPRVANIPTALRLGLSSQR